MHLDVLFEQEGRIYMLLRHDLDDFAKIEEAGISYKVETQNFYPYNQSGVTIQTDVNGEFHSYSELEQELIALEEAYPQLARLDVIGQSLEGRNIYAIKISDNATVEENEADVLFIGCHHAREWISVEVPLLLAEYLLEHYDSDPEVRNLVDQSQVWIAPLLNPDGLEYSIHFYRYWRKNRRDNGDGTYGVDPNRNYDYMWGLDDEGSSPNPLSGVYRGSGPFSEPETQAIRDFFPGKKIQALVSYHNYSQVILYPWGYTNDRSAMDDLLFEMASEMSGLMESLNGTVYAFGPAGSSLYFTNGDTTDWALGVHNIPAFTIELPPIDELHGGFFNAEDEIQPIFQENLPAALYLIEWSIQNHASSKRITADKRKIIKGRPGNIKGIVSRIKTKSENQ
jgi:murein tripeptide amidase MpaA